MSFVRFCVNCKKKVYPKKTFSWGVLVILLLIGIIPGIIYYALKNENCPECKQANWAASHD